MHLIYCVKYKWKQLWQRTPTHIVNKIDLAVNTCKLGRWYILAKGTNPHSVANSAPQMKQLICLFRILSYLQEWHITKKT